MRVGPGGTLAGCALAKARTDAGAG